MRNFLCSLPSDTNQHQRNKLQNEGFWNQVNLGLKCSLSYYTSCVSSSTLVIREMLTVTMLGKDYQK